MAGKRVLVRTQSVLFTILVEYMYPQQANEMVWIGSIIKLMEAMDYSIQAVRSVMSRMLRKKWVFHRRLGRKSYYGLTEKSKRLISQRTMNFPLYHSERISWDGSWFLLIYSMPGEEKTLRYKLRRELSFLGFGLLSDGIWLCPYDRQNEIEKIASLLGISSYLETFTCRHRAFRSDKELVESCWNMPQINQTYQAFLNKYEKQYRTALENEHSLAEPSGAEYFKHQIHLTNEYVQFKFIDPELPWELLPSDWLGEKTAAFYNNYHSLLRSRAKQFFDSVYEGVSFIDSDKAISSQGG